jgi:translation initiation factor 2 subunit 2
MTSDAEYDKLLKRAQEKLPKKVTEHSRFKVPDVDILIEGKTTVFRNFTEIVDAINRNPQDVLAYLLRELGTAGSSEGRRVIFKGRVQADQIKDRLDAYISTYVLCSECMRPDTKLIKEGRTMILECDACGAHRPVLVRKKGKSTEPVAAIEEGKVYELMIQDVGRKGDGIAKKDKYIIYVPGTTKGSIVKVHIEKVSGTMAFGKLVRE